MAGLVRNLAETTLASGYAWGEAGDRAEEREPRCGGEREEAAPQLLGSGAPDSVRAQNC